jgi:hypothetical protein
MMVVLSIFSGIFFYVNNTSFFFHWHLFLYFISNNNCRLLTTVQVFDIMLDDSQAGYWFILRFCEHFTSLSSKIQNANKLENISNLITSPSSYQCIRRKTRLVSKLVHFVNVIRYASTNKEEEEMKKKTRNVLFNVNYVSNMTSLIRYTC